jgi:hypothetical protein
MTKYRLTRENYPTAIFAEIVRGQRVVGRVWKREADYEGVIGSVTARGATEDEAFRAVVVAVGGTVAGTKATLVYADDTIDVLIADYKAGKPPTTYGDLL